MQFATEFWNNRIKDPLKNVFKQGLTPESISFSFACGVSGGLFPIPGVTTLICFIYTYLFKINAVVAQIVNLLLTPVQLMCVFLFVELGDMLFFTNTDLTVLSEAMSEGVWMTINVAGASLLRAIIAWALVSVFIIPLIYYCVLPLTRRFTIVHENVDDHSHAT